MLTHHLRRTGKGVPETCVSVGPAFKCLYERRASVEPQVQVSSTPENATLQSKCQGSSTGGQALKCSGSKCAEAGTEIRRTSWRRCR